MCIFSDYTNIDAQEVVDSTMLAMDETLGEVKQICIKKGVNVNTSAEYQQAQRTRSLAFVALNALVNAGSSSAEIRMKATAYKDELHRVSNILTQGTHKAAQVYLKTVDKHTAFTSSVLEIDLSQVLQRPSNREPGSLLPGGESRGAKPLWQGWVQSLNEAAAYSVSGSSNQIASATISSSRAKVNKSVDSALQAMLEKDPAYLEQRDDMQGIMAIAKSSAFIVEGLNAAIFSMAEDAIGNVKRQAHAICNKNELIHKRCQQIKGAPKVVSETLANLGALFEGGAQGVEERISSFCNKTPTHQKMCRTAWKFAEAMAFGVESSELQLQSNEFLTMSGQALAQIDVKPFNLNASVDRLWNFKSGETASFLSNMMLLVLVMPTGKGGLILGKGIKSVGAAPQKSIVSLSGIIPQPSVKTLNCQRVNHCGKSDCIGALFSDIKEFEKIALAFTGPVKSDLLLVQYHNGLPVGPGHSLNWWTTTSQANELPVGPGHSLNWWTTTSQANELSTMNEVMDKLSLLSNWGKRSHVSVARVRAGENIRAIVGIAKEQLNSKTGELRPGGAWQMRIADFKPEWIVDTRKLPS